MLKRIFALVLAILSLSLVTMAALVPTPDMVEPCACSHPDDRLNYLGSTAVDVLNYTNCYGSMIFYYVYSCGFCGAIIEDEYGHITIDHDFVNVICTGCGLNEANGRWPSDEL